MSSSAFSLSAIRTDLAPQSLRRAARALGINRASVKAASLACERKALALAGRRHPRTGGRILCYHALGQPQCGVNDLDPRRFARQLDRAFVRGFRFVSAGEIARTCGGTRDLALTFDDGFKSVLTRAAPILAERGIPWSLFVVSAWCEEAQREGSDQILNWRELERLAAGGVELGSHSVTHPDFGRLDPARVGDELDHSRRTMEARLGILPTSFAIPFGQSGNWSADAARAAAQAGYEIVYAQAERTRPADTIARTFVTRFDDMVVFDALLDGAFDAWEE